MGNAISQVSNEFSEPYLTLAEFKNAPTGIDWDDLVIGGNATAQDVELLNAITRASSWIDQYCNQVLAATTTTDLTRVRVGRDGMLRFAPDNSPVVALTALAYGTNPNNLQSVSDCSLAWIDSYTIAFPLGGVYSGYQSGLGLGSANAGSYLYVKYTYVNGFPNTTLSSAVSAGATSIPATIAAGITAGQMLTIYDGLKSELVTVASTYIFGSSTIPLVNALVNEHDAGVCLSAFPAAIKEAAILMTSVFLQVRGDSSLVMDVATSGSEGAGTKSQMQKNMDLAKSLLNSYRRMR